jgi:nucleolar protein 53
MWTLQTFRVAWKLCGTKLLQGTLANALNKINSIGLRFHRGVIAEKQSTELFVLDTIGSQDIKRAYHKVHKPLKADQILAQRSKVAAVDTRKRAGVTDGVLESNTKRRKVNGVKPAEYERLRRRAYGGEAVPKDIIESGEVPEKDPWAATVEKHDPRFSFLPKAKPVKAPKTLKEAPISLLEGRKKMPAVVKPKPGISYNPDVEDWSQLLIEEGEKEVSSARKRLEEAKLEREKLARIAAARDEREDMQTEDESAWEGFESEYDEVEVHSTRMPRRKTQAERNKIKRRKEAKQEEKHLAAMKKKAEQEKRIQEILKEAAANEVLVKPQTVEMQSSDDEIDERALRRRKLGKAQ